MAAVTFFGFLHSLSLHSLILSQRVSFECLLPLSGTSPQSPASLPQMPAASAVVTTVRRFRQRRRQLSSESSSVSHAWSAATAPSSIQNNPATTAGCSATAAPEPEGARAYSDPTEMMEKRKRCCERAERMRKAYRRRLREEFGQCLSGTEATAAADSGSPVSRSKHGDEDLTFSDGSRSVKQDFSYPRPLFQAGGARLQGIHCPVLAVDQKARDTMLKSIPRSL